MLRGRLPGNFSPMEIALLDTMILSYLAEAMAGDYDPKRDPDVKLREERVAAFRLFLWCRVGVGKTAVEQAMRTLDAGHRRRLQQLVMVQLPELQVPDEALGWADSRTRVLTAFHSDSEDCRILAEAEALRARCVVTFDLRMQKRLGPHSQVGLLGAAMYWRDLAIPRGTPPNLRPAWGNSIGGDDWWEW